MSASLPIRQIRIKTYLEMIKDGIIAFWDSDGNPDVNTAAALSTFVYVDDGTDVPEDLAVFPGKNSYEDLTHLNNILGNYASSKGWDALVVGDEL